MDPGSWHGTERVIKTIPKKKKCKKVKWLSEEALQRAEKRKEVKGKGEKERYTHLNAVFQRIARRDKKAFLRDQWKEIEENNRMGKTRDLFKKIRDTKGTFTGSGSPSTRSAPRTQGPQGGLFHQGAGAEGLLPSCQAVKTSITSSSGNLWAAWKMGGLPSRRGGGRKEVMGRRKSKPALEPPTPPGTALARRTPLTRRISS